MGSSTATADAVKKAKKHKRVKVTKPPTPDEQARQIADVVVAAAAQRLIVAHSDEYLRYRADAERMLMRELRRTGRLPSKREAHTADPAHTAPRGQTSPRGRSEAAPVRH